MVDRFAMLIKEMIAEYDQAPVGLRRPAHRHDLHLRRDGVTGAHRCQKAAALDANKADHGGAEEAFGLTRRNSHDHRARHDAAAIEAIEEAA